MKNKLLGISLLTVSCLYGMLAAIVILLVLLGGGDVLYAIIACIIIILIQFLISPWITDLTMRWFYKADFNASIPDYLKEFIEKECKKHNVVYPRIAVIDDGAPNAFTYGRTKKDARIVITRGIFELLKEEEVKAVVGHEMGHIVHMDMLFMTVAQVVPLVLYAIYEAFAKSNKGSNRDNNKVAIIGYIAYVLYVISQYVILWLSRTREYYADEFSVVETENPSSLAEALVKIGFGLSTKSGEAKRNVSKNNVLGIFDSNAGKSLAVSSMDKDGNISKDRIKNAMKWETWNPWALWFEFNSTHPLISKRLKRISTLSKQYNQEPYIVFDLEKPESLVDDFIFEVIIAFLPKVGLLVTIGLGIGGLFALGTFVPMFISLLITLVLSFYKFKRAHRSGYVDATVEGLLGEIKVSHITSIPCIVKGKIIGRGNPGCIFNEDFIVKDDTGIIFLDYNQPLTITNKIFALFKSEQYFDKEVTVKGWYRRSPVPYIEIYKYTVDGKEKTVYTYGLSKALYIIGALVTMGLLLASLL